MLTDPAELAELDRVATRRVQASFFRKSHPEYVITQSLDPRDNARAPTPTPEQCAAMDETWEGVSA
jgi:hypothetical protein